MGEQVSGRRSTAELTISDAGGLAKIGVRAPVEGKVAQALGVGFGRTTHDDQGHLVVGSGPGEWLVLAAPGTGEAARDRLEQTAAELDEFTSVIDLSHGRAVLRLRGDRSADLLAKVCGVDLSDSVTPHGAALRTSVARLVTDVIRDDTDGTPSYLLHCERSSGRYLLDALLDAGAEFGIEIDGITTS